MAVAAQAVLSLLQSAQFPELLETLSANQGKLDCIGLVAALA